MDAVRLSQIMDRIPPELWDAIIPASGRCPAAAQALRITAGGELVASAPQPIPPGFEVVASAVAMTRTVAEVALANEARSGDGSDVLERFVDEFSDTRWPAWWPFRQPKDRIGPVAGDGPEPWWDIASSRLAAALVLESMAGGLGDADLRDAFAAAADRLLDVATAA